MAKFALFLCLSLLKISIGWCCSERPPFSPLRSALTRNYPGTRIIDGQPASLSQFPYQVIIISQTDSGTPLCGGSIIGEQWILTAAHCVVGARAFTVLMGGNENGKIQIDTTNYVIHPEYNSNTGYADIGLIHLADSISFNDRIRPIILTSEDLYIDENVHMTVSGHGATSDNSGVSDTLNYVDLLSITNSECASVYGTATINDGTLCARGHPSQSTCSGDSGGPLVIESNGVATQVGVISWLNSGRCGIGNTRLSYYRKWIREQTGI